MPCRLFILCKDIGHGQINTIRVVSKIHIAKIYLIFMNDIYIHISNACGQETISVLSSLLSSITKSISSYFVNSHANTWNNHIFLHTSIFALARFSTLNDCHHGQRDTELVDSSLNVKKSTTYCIYAKKKHLLFSSKCHRAYIHI